MLEWRRLIFHKRRVVGTPSVVGIIVATVVVVFIFFGRCWWRRPIALSKHLVKRLGELIEFLVKALDHAIDGR